jgi:quinol monooxygenase YgiN
MIFIVVRWTVRPEYSQTWLERVDAFTKATRAEPGNLFFDWSRSVDNPHQYTLVEAFADAEAGSAHVGSAHFAEAMSLLPDLVAETPEIINVTVDASGWSRMAEVTPR